MVAKPAVLDLGGFGRAERWVSFEAKDSAVFQMKKRSGTGWITAYGEHDCTPLLALRIEGSPIATGFI
jgi:hypothetical protein